MLNERQHTGQFLILSTLDHYSRIPVTVKGGATTNDYDDGTVMAIDASDSDKAVPYDNAVAAHNTVKGILFGRCNAAEGDKGALLVDLSIGDHVVDGSLLNWKTGVDAAEQTAAITAIRALGVVVINVD